MIFISPLTHTHTLTLTLTLTPTPCSIPCRYFPLVIHAFDLIISSIGLMSIRCSDAPGQDPLAIMRRGYYVCMALAVVAFTGTCRFMLYVEQAPAAWFHFALCGLVGIFMAWALITVTTYYTDYTYGPVRDVAMASTTGHGTNIIAGVSLGMEATAIPTLVIVGGLLSSYALGSTSGLPSNSAGLYGTASATMGMLCTAVYVLTMNDLGAVVDNSGGIAEMGHCPEWAREITDRLDAVGNVTKASTKGYAVGGSALSCFVLLRALLDEVALHAREKFSVIDVAKVEVLVGGFLGIMVVFLFTGWSIKAVGTTAGDVVREVRRQFLEKPGIMNGTERPDYETCVAIVTKASLREMVKPAALVLAAPVVLGFGFKAYGRYVEQRLLAMEVVCSFLIFSSIAGLMMAIFLDTSGGAWDNAKKYVELGNLGGKGSETHKAAVTGDTVGDPFKDTAGPSLHVISNTMSTTVLVLAPLLIG
jgi:H(+)-translocating pyrophosphatase